MSSLKVNRFRLYKVDSRDFLGLRDFIEFFFFFDASFAIASKIYHFSPDIRSIMNYLYSHLSFHHDFSIKTMK